MELETAEAAKGEPSIAIPPTVVELVAKELPNSLLPTVRTPSVMLVLLNKAEIPTTVKAASVVEEEIGVAAMFTPVVSEAAQLEVVVAEATKPEELTERAARLSLEEVKCPEIPAVVRVAVVVEELVAAETRLTLVVREASVVAEAAKEAAKTIPVSRAAAVVEDEV